MLRARTLLLLLLLLAPSLARAAQTLSATAGAAANSANTGATASWGASTSTVSLLEAVHGVSGADARVSLAANHGDGALDTESKYLYLSDFGFAVPSEATILGITLTLGRRAGTAGFVEDGEVRLTEGGAATAANKARVGVSWGSEFSTATYGNEHDLWGRAWTPTAINDPSFGIAIAAVNLDSASGHSARINYALLSVSYSTVASPVFSTQTYSIPITAGWSLISTPVTPDTPLENLLASSSVDTLWSYDPSDPAAVGGWLLYSPAHPELSTLGALAPGYGYFAHAASSSALSVSGTLFAPGEAPPARVLGAGWNLVGSYAGAGEDIDDAFATIGWAGLEYTSLWRYSNATGAYTLPQSIIPGEGYWILLDAPHTYAPADL